MQGIPLVCRALDGHEAVSTQLLALIVYIKYPVVLFLKSNRVFTGTLKKITQFLC